MSIEILTIKKKLSSSIIRGDLNIEDLILVNDTAVPIECEILDYKSGKGGALSYEDTVKQITAFHNSFGGYIVYGIEETVKEVQFTPIGIDDEFIDIKKIKDSLRSYTGKNIQVTYREFKINNGIQLGVLFIPKRVEKDPVFFKKNGPSDKKNKPIFSKDDTPLRFGDNCTTAHLREHWEFLYSERDIESQYDLNKSQSPTIFVENNLPPREIICADFIGRDEELSKLWAWLRDNLSFMRLLAGEGGLGKTSIAYEFSEALCSSNPLSIEQLIWLSAKKRKFIALENQYINLPEVHFSDCTELLKQLAFKLGCTEDDFEYEDQSDYIKKIIESLRIIKSFIIIDDVDSLEIEDQKRCFEIILTISTAAQSRFLVTTRKNIFLSHNAIEVKGLTSTEFHEFISNWCKTLNIKTLKNNEINQIQSATNGSPLFTESILRLVKLGIPLGEALTQWKKFQGEEVRKAALEREVMQLSTQAKKILVAVATLGECSYRELCSATCYPDQVVTDAIGELTSLFLISAPKISNEPRYKIPGNTRTLVLQKETELVNDLASLRKSIRELRGNSAHQKSNDNFVGSTIQQAMAQIHANHAPEALETAEAALKIKPHSSDLILLKARCLENLDSDPKEVKKLIKHAYDKGCRKEILFDIWYKLELESSPADAVDIASKALENNFHNQKWREAKANAIYKRALGRNSRMFQEFIPDLLESMREFKEAAKNAKSHDKRRLADYIQAISESILTYTTQSPRHSVNDYLFFLDVLCKITEESLGKQEKVKARANELLALVRNNYASKVSMKSQEIRTLNKITDRIDRLR